jgi:hypothetical protein
MVVARSYVRILRDCISSRIESSTRWRKRKLSETIDCVIFDGQLQSIAPAMGSNARQGTDVYRLDFSVMESITAVTTLTNHKTVVSVYFISFLLWRNLTFNFMFFLLFSLRRCCIEWQYNYHSLINYRFSHQTECVSGHCAVYTRKVYTIVRLFWANAVATKLARSQINALNP